MEWPSLTFHMIIMIYELRFYFLSVLFNDCMTVICNKNISAKVDVEVLQSIPLLPLHLPRNFPGLLRLPTVNDFLFRITGIMSEVNEKRYSIIAFIIL